MPALSDSDRSDFSEPLGCELVIPAREAEGGIPGGPCLRGNIVRVVVEIGGVVRQHEVEVGNIDARLVPVDQRDAIRRHADVAGGWVAVDNAPFSSGQPRPNRPTSNDTLWRHRTEVDSRRGVHVKEVNR